MRRSSGLVKTCAVPLALLLSLSTFEPAAGGTAVPANAASLRISLGLKDKATTPWDGKIELSQGKVVGVKALSPKKATVQGSTFKISTRKPVAPPRRRRRQAIQRPLLLVTLAAPPTAKVSVATAQGSFEFVLADAALGAPLSFLGGQARVARIPLSVQLTSEPTDDDWPAAASAPDGSVWVAYTAYKSGPPLDVQALHRERKFDALVPKGHGDQVRLVRFDGTTWRAPINASEVGLDVWRPAVTVTGDGIVWVVWTQNVDGNWDLFARAYAPADRVWGKTQRLTTAPGADVYAVAATNPKTGAAHIAWMGWRDGNFDILGRSIRGGDEVRLTTTKANEWTPAIAFDSKGTMHVAFDTYEKGNYDVKLVSTGAKGTRTVAVADSPNFEARPAVAVDAADRVYVAYEQADPNWGKDFGMRWFGRSGVHFYLRRTIVVRCIEGGTVRQVAGVVPAQPIQMRYPVGARRRISLPRLGVDAAGRLWLLYRRHTNTTGGGENWCSFATYHTGDAWSPPVRLANSVNLLDNRPAVLAAKGGGIFAVHSTDGRARGTRSARHNDLFCALARVDGEAKAPALVDPPPFTGKAEPVHPNEAADVARVRAYRAAIGGKNYRLLRGEFHRHTELTSHRDQDGLLEEIWRYGLDVADMDWIGDGDHDNGGGKEYLWWLVQKQTDFFHHPPKLVPMFTYERSVVYPSGHRNAMFARRGIRPLPRIGGGRDRLFGTPEKGSPDIKTFYAYLKHFDGICASHTSGTNMGTDWRDNDPAVEPIVEIYQGHRQNYEHAGAPVAPTKQDAIGGFRPAGFVWNAWQKGYKLGIQVSSDHVSTHLSYAVVFAEDTTRQAILDAFKKRHCYGANDNIVLDVRCGDRMMGDIFDLAAKPTFQIAAVGTAPIVRLSIIRGVGSDVPRYVYNVEPNQQEIKLTWTDQEPALGKQAYYYVRIEQTRPKKGAGALAWASPMWITVKE